jgi:aminopeptidase N
MVVGAVACGSSGGDGGRDAGPSVDGAPSRPDPSENFARDILSYDLKLDLSELSGTATLQVAGDPSTGLSLGKGNLMIDAVYDSSGPLNYVDVSDALHIGLPAGGDSRPLTIDYHFRPHDNFDGWNPNEELTFLWPTFCGNLYPCNDDPADGATFHLEVTGADGTAIYPEEIPAQAPSYMPAVAVGDFTEKELGTTPAGTSVSIWYRPGEEAAATAGSAHLVDAFDFFETTYGPYSFGDKVGTVSADWGPGDYGGMEHHPFWHVSTGSLDSEETNVHEAAHGWYGNGVRIACWEDFVLSEGVVTYMAGRALEESGVDIWHDYECELKSICSGNGNTTALLDSCGEIDLISHPLWSSAPYQKGAYYLREVAKLIGVEAVDEALGEFYRAHVGGSARMRELVELLESKGKAAEIEALTVSWLESEECPIDPNLLCL